MKNGRKGILALGLAVSVLFSFVNAEAYSNVGKAEDRLRCDNKNAINSEMIMSAATGIKISGRVANVDVMVMCNLDIESIDAELILQIYAESAWPKVTSWKYTEKDCTLLESEDFTLNASGKYRTKCVITAHKGSKTETIDIYSGEKNYTHKS